MRNLSERLHQLESGLRDLDEKGGYISKALKNQTSKAFKYRSDNCKAVIAREDLATLTWDVHVVCGEEYSNSKGWAASVQIDTSGMSEGDLNDPNLWRVRVTCTCPADSYWGPDVLAKKNSFLLGKAKSTGALPTKNLRNAAGPWGPSKGWTANLACKHVLQALDLLSKTWTRKLPAIQKAIQKKMGVHSKKTKKDKERSGKEVAKK